jgi:membrane protease YdiL (CAAX protease family)
VQNNSTWVPSALSRIRWPNKAWNPGLVLVTAVGVAALNLVPGAIYIIAYATLKHVAFDAVPSFQLLLAQAATYVPVALFLLFALPTLAKVSLADLGIRRPSGRDIRVGLLGAVAMWIAVIGVGGAVAAASHRHDTETAVALLKSLKSPYQLTVFFLVACVFAPIIEELTFRVFIFNALTKWASVSTALIVSGVLFGAVHAIGSPPAQVLTIGLPLACGGAVLGYVYATTRCFWSNVTTHACFNAVNTIALVFFHAT